MIANQVPPHKRGQHRKFWIVMSGLAPLLVLVSCMTLNQDLFIPPEIPGATFIGSEECSLCHDEISAGFTAHADHAMLTVQTTNTMNVGCEACHGPGSVHSDSAGEPNTIINPKKSPQVCFQCHLDKLGQFRNAPHHHPVIEGRMACNDCHNPHKASLVKSGGASMDHMDSLCFDCHAAQRGPFVFEHEAVREGCLVCHDPHGSVNAKMLTQRNANLCLKCHFQQRSGSAVVIGGYDHTALLSRGTCWSAGCHEAIHGSQVSRSLRY